MPKLHYHDKSMLFVSRAGCFLPFLIIFNLLFGWMFFKLLAWLLIEVGLVLLFMLSARIAMRKVFSAPSRRGNVIDIEGEAVDEKRKLK